MLSLVWVVKSHDDENFESAESGVACVFLQQAGGIRKGGRTMIKEHPCKVAEVIDVPANMQPQVPAIQVVPRTMGFIDSGHSSCTTRDFYPHFQNVQKTVEITQVHYVDKIVGVLPILWHRQVPIFQTSQKTVVQRREREIGS